MIKMKKFFLPFMMLGILLLAVGCANSEETDTSSNSSESNQNESSDNSKEAQENIKIVLENTFTGPDDEQQEIIFRGEDEGIEEFADKLSEYQEENFKPYVSERYYENGIVKTNGAIGFLVVASPKYILNVDEVTLEDREAKEGDYNFNVSITYTNKENDKSETMNVEGTASTNEEGKITSIRYLNDEEFRKALEN
ncbi:hypothetical protein [Guptibacillus hwajinpoensis]|uniref:hypothetical protein n=1 Tax=Guptibacillus hwajinpoensis TaxID=208199 RepID=UPI001CFE40AB|nr:hypothetical protein [Pseudalkalibacillus hwajinpoensis]WLR59028.1 hypothetical protein LC071_18035 [Pseudalkalibacillus hwajinpoensis]